MDERQSMDINLKHIIASIKSTLSIYLVQNPERKKLATQFLSKFSCLPQDLRLSLLPELKQLSSAFKYNK